MRSFKSLSTLFAIVLGTSFSQAQSFEGVITFNTTNASINETATVAWYHKGDKNLMEFDSKTEDKNLSYSMIMGANESSVYLVTGQGSQELSGVQGEEVFTSAKFVRKAKTEEGGYACEMLMFKTGGKDLTYWVTSDIDIPYSELPQLMRNNMPSFKGISDAFPLKMELRDSDGNLLRSQEVVTVDARKIEDSKFKR